MTVEKQEVHMRIENEANRLLHEVVIPKHKDAIDRLIAEINGFFRRKYEPKDIQVEVKPHCDYTHRYENAEDTNRWFFVRLQRAEYAGCLELLSFYIDTYPFCCAMLQLNGFKHINLERFTQELFNAFVNDVCFAANGKPQRVVMAMPEQRRGKTSLDIHTPIENPAMPFPLWYQWAKSKAKFQEMLFTNNNTRAIIHFCEVVF